MNKPDELDDYYFNSEGLVVFTAEYLLQRGYCCGNGCLNCPFDYKDVPEPRKTQLLQKREEEKKKNKPS